MTGRSANGRVTLVLALALLVGGSLAACAKQDGDDPLVITANGASGGMGDQFGEDFEKAFRADPKSEPTRITKTDMPPVSRTAEPVTID